MAPRTPARARPTLRRIANAVGVGPESFYVHGPTDPLADAAATTELLRLWTEVTHDGDRAKVLALLRGLASRRDG